MIRVVLIVGFLLALVAYVRSFRSVVTDRLIAMLLFFLVSLTILFPDSTTLIAQFLGVGRGTDLVLYLYIVGSFFAIVLLYGRSLNNEQKLTKLVREIAIENVTKQ